MFSGTRSDFKSVLLVCLLLTSSLIFVFQFSGVLAGSDARWGPYITLKDGPTPVINWKSSEPTVGRVAYDRAAHYYGAGNFRQVVKEEKPGLFHHLALSDLSPGTEYAYRILSGGSDQVYRFRSYEKAPEAFQFFVYGDTQTCPLRNRLVASEMAADPASPAFILHAGDLVKSPVSPHWRDFFWANEPLLSSIPLVSALGNHERNDDSYYRALELPQGGGDHGEEWYSFEYGPVNFIVLDSNAAQVGLKEFLAQSRWLEKELEGQTRPGTVVLFHHPIYSSVYSTGVDSGLERGWGSLFRKYGVDLVFSGHVHSYERIVRDGITYVVSGGGGGPSGILRSKFDFSRRSRGDSLHYVRVTVSQSQMELEAIEVARVDYLEGVEDSPCSFALTLSRSVIDSTVVEFD